ncbi:MAG: hypothetical protein H0W28_07520 [Pyrinomonadaceae bacterium]|nr:hypothetical protein [Pyrinomonadaceae bacterium]
MTYTREAWGSPEHEDQAQRFLEEMIFAPPTFRHSLDNSIQIDYGECMKRLESIVMAAILEHEYREAYGGREEGV